MKRWVIAGIGALVVFILIGVFSVYYIVGVANRATYKRQTQALIVKTFSALKKTKYGDARQSLVAFEQLKKDSREAADQLETRPAPSGAEELKTDAVQVVDMAADIADRGILMFGYVDKVNRIVNRWGAELKSAASLSDPIAKLRKLQTITDKAGAELKDLKPPTALVAFHLELTDLLGTMTTKLGDMVTAANAKDTTKLNALSSELGILAARINKSSTIGSDVADDIMPPSDKRKLDRLANKIDRF